jgi:ABC-type transport system involved in multi-copper enzyme maturation permease subunit
VVVAVIPVAAVVSSGSALFGTFSGSWLALGATLLAAAVLFSAVALALSTWVRGSEPALWTTFFLVLLLIVGGGAVVPLGGLPEVLQSVGGYSPTAIVARLISGALAKFDAGAFGVDLLRLGVWAAAASVFAWLGLKRRAASYALG